MIDIKVTVNDFSITLDVSKWTWSPVDKKSELLAISANSFTLLHPYSTADGEPGYRLAKMIARMLKGNATLPTTPNNHSDSEAY